MAVHARPTADSVNPHVDFQSIVCGVDASPQSVEAVRQAITLASGGAHYSGVAAWDPGLPLCAGLIAADVMTELREEAASAGADARKPHPQAWTRYLAPYSGDRATARSRGGAA